MANAKIADLLEAIKAIIDTVPDIGTVLTRERHTGAGECLVLFTAMNSDESPKGVMILFSEFVSQGKGPRMCTVQQRLRFGLEIFYPFDDERPDGLTSHEVFISKIEEINDALNATGPATGSKEDWDLGLTPSFPHSEVEHQFLQSTVEAHVKEFGTGSTGMKVHYASYSLDVNMVSATHTPALGS